MNVIVNNFAFDPCSALFRVKSGGNPSAECGKVAEGRHRLRIAAKRLPLECGRHPDAGLIPSYLCRGPNPAARHCHTSNGSVVSPQTSRHERASCILRPVAIQRAVSSSSLGFAAKSCLARSDLTSLAGCFLLV